MKDVLFEHDILHVCLNATASQLPGASGLLVEAHERLEKHCGHFAASH